jgi:hypothetical protein
MIIYWCFPSSITNKRTIGFLAGMFLRIGHPWVAATVLQGSLQIVEGSSSIGRAQKVHQEVAQDGTQTWSKSTLNVTYHCDTNDNYSGRKMNIWMAKFQSQMQICKTWFLWRPTKLEKWFLIDFLFEKWLRNCHFSVTSFIHLFSATIIMAFL